MICFSSHWEEEIIGDVPDTQAFQPFCSAKPKVGITLLVNQTDNVCLFCTAAVPWCSIMIEILHRQFKHMFSQYLFLTSYPNTVITAVILEIPRYTTTRIYHLAEGQVGTSFLASRGDMINAITTMCAIENSCVPGHVKRKIINYF